MRRVLPLVGYIATIFAANWAIKKYGPVPVGFGYQAPAGVYFAGLALVFRDFVQEALGRVPVVAAIVAGAVLSALLAPSLAVASGVAFLVSELADFAVYTPLRSRGLALAVLASGAVGLVVDSVLFLHLAFGSLAFLPGQVIAKGYMTVAAAAFVLALRGNQPATEGV